MLCCDNYRHSTSRRLHAAAAGHSVSVAERSLLHKAALPEMSPLSCQGTGRPAPLPACPAPIGACTARCGRAQSRCHSPGVDLQLAGGHVAARELVHAVVPPIVGGEDAKQQRARLRGENEDGDGGEEPQGWGLR